MDIISDEFNVEFDLINYNVVFMPNPSGTINPSMPLVEELAAINTAGFPGVTSNIMFLLPS